MTTVGARGLTQKLHDIESRNFLRLATKDEKIFMFRVNLTICVLCRVVQFFTARCYVDRGIAKASRPSVCDVDVSGLYKLRF